MTLPDPLVAPIKKYFACHGCWHNLRFPPHSTENVKFRPICFKPNVLWPEGLQGQGDAHSGEQFLRFHREMIRNFKWIVENASGAYYAYKPWLSFSNFPSWLLERLNKLYANYTSVVDKKLKMLAASRDLDALGMYIEGDSNDFPYVHFTVHSLIHDYEQGNMESDMGCPKTAPLNEYFWVFHGWIDGLYADWQKVNGQFVDQTPLRPDEPVEMCSKCMHDDCSNSPWLEQWELYLEFADKHKA